MANNYKIKVKAGETKNIFFTVKDADNLPVNLDNKDVYFTIKRNNTNIVELASCAISNQTTDEGQAKYSLTSLVSSEFVKGEYQAEVCVVDEFGDKLFYPNSADVSKDFISIVVSIPLAVPE